jgi:LemA protein
MTSIIVLVILGAFVFYVVGVYNKLVSLRNLFKNGFAQIDVQLLRRYDLIPNLVETAKAYMSHEKETLNAVIAARNQASELANQMKSSNADNGEMIKKLANAERAVGQSLMQLYAVAEAYPDLKANQTMQSLMEELTSTENKVSFARQAYNDAVMQYNTYREQFPGNFVAGFGAFLPAELFILEEPEAKKAVKVNFS